MLKWNKQRSLHLQSNSGKTETHNKSKVRNLLVPNTKNFSSTLIKALVALALLSISSGHFLFLPPLSLPFFSSLP